jgi:hypothetical protein
MLSNVMFESPIPVGMYSGSFPTMPSALRSPRPLDPPEMYVYGVPEYPM